MRRLVQRAVLVLFLFLVVAVAVTYPTPSWAQKALGQACTTHQECQSQRCDNRPGAGCVAQDGTGNVGEFCTTHQQCRTGMCVIPAGRLAGQCHERNSKHGTTSISVPSTLLTVRVDNGGNVTGTGSQLKISHSDPGDFCRKVDKIEVLLYAKYCSGTGDWCWYGPPDKMLHLCNFNQNDATFDIAFPAAHSSHTSIVKQAWVNECQASGKNGAQLTTQHPFFKRDPSAGASLIVRLQYYGTAFTQGEKEEETYPVPPVNLTCDACPQFNVQDSLQLQQDTMVTITVSSIVSGGIGPYTVWFSRLPTGMFLQGGNLTGRPAIGTYEGAVTVRDNCKSANNQITKNFRFRVTDPVAPTIAGATAAPNVVPSAGGPVAIRVTASDNGAVTSVKAHVISAGGARVDLPLTRTGGTAQSGVWEATYTAHANTTTQGLPYSVAFEVADNGGNVVNSAGPGFVVEGKDGTPPQILAVTLVPNSLSAQGGDITLSVRASDNIGVAQVLVTQIQPNGQQSSSNVPPVSGTPTNGEWRLKWGIGANAGTTAQTYTMNVQVRDAAGNAVSAQPIQLRVTGLVAAPPAPQGSQGAQPYGVTQTPHASQTRPGSQVKPAQGLQPGGTTPVAGPGPAPTDPGGPRAAAGNVTAGPAPVAPGGPVPSPAWWVVRPATAQDAPLAQSVNVRLQESSRGWSAAARSVSVEVANGAVRLTGKVASAQERAAIENTVRSTQGVRAVTNATTVGP